MGFSGAGPYKEKAESARNVITADLLTSSPPQAARIPTASAVSCGASVGSSHSRLTSAEDDEEASLLGLPAHRSAYGGQACRRLSGLTRIMNPRKSKRAPRFLGAPEAVGQNGDTLFMY
jgi:hypothetical protein